MSELIKADNEYKEWIAGISTDFRKSQIRASMKINDEMLRFYWKLGKGISSMSEQFGYGTRFYKTVSDDLKSILPDVDIPVLAEEFLRAGVDIDMMKRKFIDVQVIYHKLEQRTLSAAYKFYCGKNLEDAHTAEADTRATYEVLKSQLDRYPEELQNDMAFLAEYSSFNKNVDFAGRIVYDDKGVEVFNFGKYKGMSVSEVLQKDPGYYSWILNGDFTLNTKNVLTKIRLRESGMMK